MMYAGIYDMPIGRWWDANENEDPIHLVQFKSLRFLYPVWKVKTKTTKKTPNVQFIQA